MAVALHVLPDDRSVERDEQRRRTVAFVVVGHSAGAALLHRQAGLDAAERLDLRLLVDRQHHRMGRRIDIQADDIRQLWAKAGSFDSLKWRQRCGLRPCAFQIACTVDAAMPAALAIVRSVQWVASCGAAAAPASGGRSRRRAPAPCRADATCREAGRRCPHA